MVYDIMERQGLKLKPKMAAELRKQSGELDEGTIAQIMDALSVKKRSANVGVSLKLPNSICEKYFEGMDTDQMAALVEQALAAWFESGGRLMFNQEHLDKTDKKYFNVILMDDRDITIQSRNTGHALHGISNRRGVGPIPQA